MSWQAVVFVLGPVVVGLVVFGAVAVVAIGRARPEDVPGMMHEFWRGLRAILGHREDDDDHGATRPKGATR